jgi:hypothetical protein
MFPRQRATVPRGRPTRRLTLPRRYQPDHPAPSPGLTGSHRSPNGSPPTAVHSSPYSNTSSGESVNCGIHGAEANDIHLALAKTKTEPDECNSFTAEITPHFRPAEWVVLSTLHKTTTKTAAERIAAWDLDRPLRITGQMMMDGSHKPCTPGHPQSPKRISVWEIHPVYAVDVCKKKSISSCRAGVVSDWVALDVWLADDNDGG